MSDGFLYDYLAIIGLSTVTTSMFVFLERDLREKHKIPWFLRWLSFDVQPKQLRRENYRRGRGESTSDALLGGHRHLNGFVGDGSGGETAGARKVKSYAQSMAMSLMKLVPNSENSHDLEENGNHRTTIPHDNPAFDNQSPRHALRRRLSLSHYDNMIVYQYFNQILEDAVGLIQKIEGNIQGMRYRVLDG
uniref:Uncharacterized protein n=1 Tax=Panagrolaimus superbus TaxID=310955 RepID=A0A914XYI5_9BILA